MDLKIAYIGAGSRQFGAAIVTDLLLSRKLSEASLRIVLMDIDAAFLNDALDTARATALALNSSVPIEATLSLSEALDGCSCVICAIEVNRYFYWAQDFHIPRKYGFDQAYGENGEIGGVFHALRNMQPVVEIAQTMERLCPDAWLLNFTNPEHKLCEAVTRLTGIHTVGLCHGVFMGMKQISYILGKSPEQLLFSACGMNHFTWFQHIEDRDTGQDLYPLLREREAEGNWVCEWHEIGMSRLLFRLYGLWPSPGANHVVEYLWWAKEYVAENLQYFYDPGAGEPWTRGEIPEFVYTMDRIDTKAAWSSQGRSEDQPSAGGKLEFSGEAAVPIIESLACGVENELPAVNITNQGVIPGLPDDMVVEVPARASAAGITALPLDPLPEGITNLLRHHGGIHRMLVEAYREQSRDLLIQTLLLEPIVNSYRRLIPMIDEFLELQAELLPPFS